MSLNKTVTSSKDLAVVYPFSFNSSATSKGSMFKRSSSDFSFCFTTSAVLIFTVCSRILFCFRKAAVRQRYIPYNRKSMLITAIVLNHQVRHQGGKTLKVYSIGSL